MLLNLQSRTARLLSFRDEPTLRRFCTHCGPMLTEEVELEQLCQERRLVWSVKIRRVRLTRCVFRYGPRDGMTYSAVKPID